MTMPVNALSSALQQMQSMAAQAAGGTSPAAAEQSGAATAGGFASALKASLDKISGDQKTAIGESQAFELGSSNVSLNDVMVDMQKANVGFQFGLQVRNKLVVRLQRHHADVGLSGRRTVRRVRSLARTCTSACARAAVRVSAVRWPGAAGWLAAKMTSACGARWPCAMRPLIPLTSA